MQKLFTQSVGSSDIGLANDNSAAKFVSIRSCQWGRFGKGASAAQSAQIVLEIFFFKALRSSKTHFFLQLSKLLCCLGRPFKFGVLYPFPLTSFGPSSLDLRDGGPCADGRNRR